MKSTPEEVILCAVLCLFPHHVEAVCWHLWLRLVSLDRNKSVPNHCQEKGTRIVWAKAVSSSTSTTLFQNGWETSCIYMRTSGKEKGQVMKPMAATSPEADGVLWKRLFSPRAFSSTLRTVALKSRVRLVGGEVKAWFSSSPVSFARAVCCSEMRWCKPSSECQYGTVLVTGPKGEGSEWQQKGSVVIAPRDAEKTKCCLNFRLWGRC